MKIGLLLATYKDAEYIEKCLTPWINLSKKYNILISVCHGLFKEYHENGIIDDDSQGLNKLLLLDLNKKIDYLYVQNYYGLDFARDIKKYETEAEIRNYGLKFLLSHNIDYLWTIGADEIYKEQEIINIIEYIQKNKLYSFFKINYKNFVFDKEHYIDGFCPPRIWSNNQHGKIDKFYWDDDIIYKDGTDYKQTSCKIIPKNIAFPDHFTWLSDERSYNKVKYQNRHFGHCGYKWNYNENKLEFNYEFYQKTNQILPKVIEC